MARERRRKNKSLKARLIATTTLKISPILLAIVMVGNYVVDTLKGDFVPQWAYDDLKDQFVNEQVIEYPPHLSSDTITSSPEPTIDLEIEDTTVTDGLDDARNDVDVYDNFVENEDKIELSDKLLKDGFEFSVIDFNGLEQVNDDVTAWINIPGTNIDYPVVQGTDNSYYLNHDFYNNESKLGAIYSDSRQNALDVTMSELSDISIVYGHNFSGKRMFNELCNFKSQSYFDNHNFGIIYTPDGYAYEVEFFAGVVIDGGDDSVLYTADFIDEDVYDAYIQNIRDNSRFTSDVEVEFGDKVVALVTCSYETDNSRFVLYGRLGKQYTNEMQIEDDTNKVLVK